MKAELEKYAIRKILVPVDFSETSNQAVRQSIILAKAANAEIRLLHVVNTVHLPPDAPLSASDSIMKSVTKNTTVSLKKMTERIRTNDQVRISFSIVSGNVPDSICGVADSDHFDLIVMGTHGTSGVREFFAGSTAYRVVRHSSCPVLSLQHASSLSNLKKIVLPIRLERSSRQKVDYVVELARLLGSTILIAGFTEEKAEAKQLKIKQYVAQVENYLSKLDIPCKSKLIFAPGFSRELLKYAARTNAGLVVAMREHDFSFDQLVKGSYAEQFVNHSTLPVLTIPVVNHPDLMEYAPYLSGVAPF